MVSFEELQKLLNDEIRSQTVKLTGQPPAGLYAPVNYSLDMGGKRLRPVLLLMAYNLFSDEIEKALPAALALEIFHNFTLLHDDIMDKAHMRRNKPTVHQKFSDNSAILSGDAMAFLSYRYLMQLQCPSDQLFEVTQLFTETALKVCEGQQYDMDFENRQDVTEEEYLKMIKLKTAVLLACSLKSGALLASASPENARLLYDYGINLGLAFQLQDDFLDTFGNQEKFGKKIGGDIVANKKTFLLIKALQEASESQKKKLEEWLGKKEFIAGEKIETISGIFRNLNIPEITEEKIDSYFIRASKILNDLPVEESKKRALKGLSNNMLKRNN